VTAGPGRDVDDAAVLLLPHGRQHRAHAVEHTIQVDLDDLVPAFQFHVGPAPLRHVEAGAVDQEVDPAVLCQDLVSCLVHIGLIADIELDRLGLAALCGDLGDDAFEFFLAATRNYHGPAVGRQKFRPRLADSAATTGHPGHAFPVI
jgi:hypothetical protein